MRAMKPGEYEKRRRDIMQKIEAAEIDFRAAALAVETGAGSKEDRTAARVRLDELKDDLVSLSAANELSGKVAALADRERTAAEWDAFQEACATVDAQRVAVGAEAIAALEAFAGKIEEFHRLGGQELRMLQPLVKRLRDPMHFRETRDTLVAGGRALGVGIAHALFRAGVDVSNIDQNTAKFGPRYSLDLVTLLTRPCEIEGFAPKEEHA